MVSQQIKVIRADSNPVDIPMRIVTTSVIHAIIWVIVGWLFMSGSLYTGVVFGSSCIFFFLFSTEWAR